MPHFQVGERHAQAHQAQRVGILTARRGRPTMLRHSALHILRPRHLSRRLLLSSVLARIAPQAPVPAAHSLGFRASFFTREEADDQGKKRLIVCCDGTWKNAAGTIVPPTNVARFARSIDRHGHTRSGEPAVPQLAYYAAGVGASSVLPVPIDYLYSGATGEGLGSFPFRTIKPTNPPEQASRRTSLRHTASSVTTTTSARARTRSSSSASRAAPSPCDASPPSSTRSA